MSDAKQASLSYACMLHGMWTSKLSKLHVADVDKDAGKDASVAWSGNVA